MRRTPHIALISATIVTGGSGGSLIADNHEEEGLALLAVTIMFFVGWLALFTVQLIRADLSRNRWQTVTARREMAALQRVVDRLVDMKCEELVILRNMAAPGYMSDHSGPNRLS